jgi:DNA primase catalytic core
MDAASSQPRRKRPLRCVLVFATLSAVTSACQAFTLRPSTSFRNRNQQDHGEKLSSFQLSKRARRIPSWHRCRSSLSTSPSGAPAGDPTNATSSYFVSPEQLADLKESINIVDVVESYNLPKFERRGDGGAVAICPFHDDRKPSMSMDNKRQLYKCFSCGAGGDAFKFVRDYSALQGEEMSFFQSVRTVAQVFGNGKLEFAPPSGQSRMSEEERQALQAKKQQLLLINAAAAAYFGTLLISLPSAGQARAHLRTRGLSPATVQAFALGFAPDCYFDLKPNAKWGEGSLVYNLKSLGFTPDEIVDSGLATRTKRAQMAAGDAEIGDGPATERSADYTTLIDRFRGRIMVPIFDAGGKNVIAFGGRILPSLEQGNENSDFKPPKYLNSPESLVFHKTDELFGLHAAKDAVQEQKAKAEQDSQRLPGSILIVEGYMDVITLWEAGIRESVACMGTALTLEQLASAAKAAGTMGGRIILCLDNDEAGINAVERVCSNMFLAKTAEKFVVEIVVAHLPPGIKDPADFIEANKGGTKGGAVFREQVLRQAEDWTTWYLKRILSRYNEKALRGTPGSFGDMCDRVSEFLATFPNPADRTKMAHDIANNLVELVAKSSGSGEVSNSFRIQLESDLVDMVSRKAAAKESLGRRIEAVDGFAPNQQDDKLSQMSKGLYQADESKKLSTKAFKESNPVKARVLPQRLKPALDQRDVPGPTAGRKANNTARKAPPGTRKGIKRDFKKTVYPSMTPYFQGFEFENESDAEWLGLARQKSKRKNGDLVFGINERYQKMMLSRFGAAYAPGLKDNFVYFNSNEYHGKRFLTQEAMDAGYTNNGPAPSDRKFLELGIATLIRDDPETMIRRGEDALLRNLVQYGPARSAMKTAIASSEATGSRYEIEWSSHDREWLFTYLVERQDEIPSQYLEAGTIKELREYLASKYDAPKKAFSSLGFAAAVDVSRKRDIVVSVSNGAIMETNGVKATDTTVLNVDAEAVNTLDRELQISSDNNEIDKWASSYDPADFDDDFTLQQDLNIPQDSDSTTLFKAAKTEDGVIDTEFTTEASADPVNPPSRLVSFKSDEEPHLGTLDQFFLQPDDLFAATYDESVPRELRAELEVQEALATLLKASALKRLASVNANWLVASRLLNARLEAENGATEPSDKRSNIQVFQSGIEELDSMETRELHLYCQAVLGNLNSLFQTAHQLEVAWKRIKSRIFDYTGGDEAEGKISASKQNELFGMVEDFLNDLPEDWQPNEIEDLVDPDHVFSLYVSDDPQEVDDNDDDEGASIPDSLTEDESLEKDLKMIDSEWSEWNDEDYRWAPGDDARANNPFVTGEELNEMEADAFSNADEESLEDAIARIDNDWADWGDDDGGDDDGNSMRAPTSRQQPLTLQYSDAEYGEYKQLAEPQDEAPSYFGEDNVDLPRVVAVVTSAAGSTAIRKDEPVDEPKDDVEPNFDSVWE